MEACQRCHEVDEDRRTLMMACFYDMDELKIPFRHELIQQHIQDSGQKFYTLRVCKGCRAEWMESQKSWFFNVIRDEESCGSGIFVMRNGVPVEISEEAWRSMYPDREPVRFRGNDQ